MNGTATAKSWLLMLRRLLPPVGVVVVGAGAHKGSWARTLKAWKVENALLVEGSKDKIDLLAAEIPQNSQWELLNISARGDESENEGFENLATVLQTQRVRINWAIIECSHAASILQGAQNYLSDIDVMIARIAVGSEKFDGAFISRHDLTKFLKKNGFRYLGSDESGPASGFHYIFFARGAAARVKALKGNEKVLGASPAQTAASISTLESRLYQLEQKCLALADGTTKILEYLDDVIPAINRFDDACEKLERLGAIEAKIDLSQNRLDSVGRVSLTLHDLAKGIQHETRYGVKQIESFIAIQNLLIHGLPPLDFWGWPISSDAAVLLVESIQKNRFDAIVEFGSGTSTVLFARLLVALKIGGENEGAILSFEHDEFYFQKTKENLVANRVSGLVNLSHSKLVDWESEAGSFLFYDCKEPLREFAKNSCAARKNILVFVDGPPGRTNRHARYPALPHILEAFPGKQVHVYLDDCNRVDETDIVEKWRQLLKKSEINFVDKIESSGRGLYSLIVDIPLK